MLKVYVERQEQAYEQMFIDNGWEAVDDIKKADLLCLTGGEDVSPSMYGEDKHSATYSSDWRDEDTEALVNIATSSNIPIVGVCRGSQFLCVYGGGRLWQDVDGHAIGRTHQIRDMFTSELIDVSSTHHQQHRPSEKAIIVAVASPQLSTVKTTDHKAYYVDEWRENSNISQDVEAFFYEDKKLLGCQFHPEYFNKDEPCQEYFFELIERYLSLRA